MESIKTRLMSFLLKKYVLGYLVSAWDKIKGNKTLLCGVGLFLVPFLQAHGLVTPDQAEQLNTALGTGAGFSFMQKLARYKPVVDGVIAEVKKESPK